MSIKINKNEKEYPLGFMPEHYPADRVYLDGDTSKTVQDRLTWKLKGSKTGTTAIALPSTYSELLIHVKHGQYFNYTFYLVSANDDGYYRNGYRDNSYATIKKDNGSINLAELFENGTDHTSSTVTYVYYR